MGSAKRRPKSSSQREVIQRAVARALRSHKAASGNGRDEATAEWRKLRAQSERLKILELEGKLLPRDQVREALGRLAALIRNAGEILERQFGPEASRVVNEALDDFEREVSGIGK